MCELQNGKKILINSIFWKLVIFNIFGALICNLDPDIVWSPSFCWIRISAIVWWKSFKMTVNRFHFERLLHFACFFRKFIDFVKKILICMKKLRICSGVFELTQNMEDNGCAMTYMYELPVYVRVNLSESVTQVQLISTHFYFSNGISFLWPNIAVCFSLDGRNFIAFK